MAGAAHAERGAAALELALTLPILLVIIFGIIDFGRIINTEMTRTEASREGPGRSSSARTPPRARSWSPGPRPPR